MSLTEALVVENKLAARGLHHIAIDFGDSGVPAAYTRPGQFVQLSVGGGKPGFYAIASPPSEGSTLEFLVKRDGQTSTALCELWPGASVHSSSVMGGGFPTERAAGCDLLIFAAGSGIAPIRALIEHGLGDRVVHLYYGAFDRHTMAYKERFDAWRAAGVSVHVVYDRESEDYEGPTGFVQDLYRSAPPPVEPARAAAVLCGMKGMVREVTELLVGQGMPPERVLLNF